MLDARLSPSPRGSIWMLPAGCAIAFVSSLCGIGGGLFTVPLLHFGFRVPLRYAVATSLVLVAASTSMATLTEALQPDSALDLLLIGAIACGALAGAQVGYRVSNELDTQLLRKVFVVVLFGVGLRILMPQLSHLETATPLGASGLDISAYVYGLVVGMAGGFLSPILGIGGGLVFVPALLLGLPMLEFEGARACSMAVSLVTAIRSLILYSRERCVLLQAAFWLGSGAVVGAGLAVLLFHHLAGVREVAQPLLGLILWVVAGRFALDAWRNRSKYR
ncbi:MAG TPA: sulfite exporter TauE/SafE family protein [Planctomycetota bacterium]|nr:sulfite exporter TauE/SafE family protein [Planctomycetota bacterium]